MIERLQAFLRAIVAPGHEVVSLPPFTAYFDPRDPLRFFNYAIPDADVEPGPEAVDELRRAFRARERLPRLEWIEEAAPRVAPVLAACGMAEELRSPLMACAPEELLEAPVALDDLLVSVVISDGDVGESDAVQRAAFGVSIPSEPSTHRRRVLARVQGEPVAAAGWSPVEDEVAEIVGVATAEPWRGRGLAGAVTAAAARAAFASGASLCVLSPGDEVAQRVYARAGFRRVATMLHWSDPEP